MRIVLAVIGAGVLALAPSGLFACSCGGPATEPRVAFEAMVRLGDAPVVIAEVRRQLKHPTLEEPGVEFAVRRVLRGADRKTVTVWSSLTCGADVGPFTVGSRWALILHPDPDEGVEFQFDICSRTWFRVGDGSDAVTERELDAMVKRTDTRP